MSQGRRDGEEGEGGGGAERNAGHVSDARHSNARCHGNIKF